jgi:hypothetical protein
MLKGVELNINEIITVLDVHKRMISTHLLIEKSMLSKKEIGYKIWTKTKELYTEKHTPGNKEIGFKICQ